MSVDIERQINKLGRIKINSGFRVNLRTDLMEKTAINKPIKMGGFGAVAFNILHVGFFKHGYAPIALGIFIFFGSGALAMMAAGDSLPGEFLYGVKRAGEKARITLTLGETSKIGREMNFAENRVKELSRLTDEETRDPSMRLGAGKKQVTSDTPVYAPDGSLAGEKLADEGDKADQKAKDVAVAVAESKIIAKAVDDFHNELSKVNVRLDSLGGNNNNAAKTARAVQEKTGEFVETLNQVAQKEKLSTEVREKIARAFNILDEVNSRALGFVIKERLDIGDEEMNELIKRLDDKIAATEERLANVDEIMKGEGVVGDSQGVLLSLEKKIELAKIILMEARESLVARDLEMTLQKVGESKELAIEVSEELDGGAAGRLESQETDDNEVNNGLINDGLIKVNNEVNNDELIVEEIDEVTSNK